MSTPRGALEIPLTDAPWPRWVGVMAGPDDLLGAKRALRAQLRDARQRLGSALRAALSARIADHVLALPAWGEARTVMLYLALPEEVDTERLAQEALAQGKRLCVPRLLTGGAMEAVHVESLTAVALAGLPHGLRQPAPGVGATVAPGEIDLNLAPCVGVDRAGYRLGLGGGHYDRFLAQRRPGATALGLVFSCQVVDRLPRGAHDQRLDGWVTEDGIVSCA